ncbi:hypothetical protein BH10BAC5_BH10BAC5_04650 [soil metagenome]
MPNTDSKAKKQKVMSLIREINISKEDMFGYLSTLGVGNLSINTSLEADVVDKVHSHFKKEIEKEDKRIKKTKAFVDTLDIDITEVNKIQEKEENERVRIEEEARFKKMIEEENKRKEEERQRQETEAYKERSKTLEDQEKVRVTEAKEKAKTRRIAKEKAAEGTDTANTPAAADDKTKPKSTRPLKTDTKAETTAKNLEIAAKTDYPQAAPRTDNRNEGRSSTVPPRKFVPGQTGERPPYKKPPFERRDGSRPPASGTGTAAPGGYKKPGTGEFKKVTLDDIRKKRPTTYKPDDKGAPPRPPSTGTGPKRPFTPSSDASKTKFEEERRFKEKKDRDKKKFELEAERKRKANALRNQKKDITQKEIDEAIRDTFAKIDDDAGSSARSQARKRKKKERAEEDLKIQELADSQKNVIKVTEYLSTSELANLMNIEANELIKACFKLGMMVSINQRLEKDLIVLLAEEFGYKIEFITEYEEDILEDTPDAPESLKPRAPVVTIMGHVDHGKTSLLDYIRKANVVAGEAGGITQHIGAYKVQLESGKEIAFLDTPGHEAFTAMRARGGQAADIVVLVVAADDSVMPQTVEAINHALAANVPIIVAINKVDKPEANPERIKQQLADKNILVEEWGGKYQSVEISAKHGKNIEALLDKILLEAEVLDLKANPDTQARAVVIEARLDKGKGSVATILVQKGILNIGDIFVAGVFSGKVKAMYDEREHKLEHAGPSTPVQVLGFDGVPQAGDSFIVLDSDRAAKAISLKRQQLKREQDFRQVKFITLDDISKQIQEGKQVELKIILKADFDGSAEALADSLHKLTTPEARVIVIHKAIGQITESDVLLAEASNAIIIGFNVRPNLNARKLAEKNAVDVRLYSIIYNVIEEVKTALEGMLEPELSEEVTCTIEVRDVFKVPKIGNIAGCFVQDGKVTRATKVRLLREGLVIFSGNISSLKRHKDDAKEVDAGYECGVGLENFNDIKVGDVIEGYKVVETKRKLSSEVK